MPVPPLLSGHSASHPQASLGERIMARPVTLFTGQWADLTLEVICQKASQWGYDGIELPCWGDHFQVQKALSDPGYCKGRHELLGKYALQCWAISNHLVGHRPEFGFNFDPSHLHWQMVDPVEFIRTFPDRIYHVHVKDAARTLDGRSGILASHLNFGDPRRGWDFRSPGRGQVNFEEIARALNHIGYDGPLSVEWEDSGMDREYGAAEAARFG